VLADDDAFVGIPLAQDGRFNGDRTRSPHRLNVSLNDSIDTAVPWGISSWGLFQDLLPDQFRCDHALCLVGQAVFRKITRPRLQVFLDFSDQYVHSVAGLGTDRDDGRKVVGLTESCNQWQQGFLFIDIDLLMTRMTGFSLPLLACYEHLCFTKSRTRGRKSGLNQSSTISDSASAIRAESAM